jgi:hypothetical protein
VLFLAVSMAVVVNVIVSMPLQSAAGSMIILGGLPVYAYVRRRGRTARP